jgi:hypothetical protein
MAGAQLCAPDNPERKMKNLMLGISAMGLALVVASPAEAAKKLAKHKRHAATQTMQHRQSAGAPRPTDKGHDPLPGFLLTPRLILLRGYAQLSGG